MKQEDNTKKLQEILLSLMKRVVQVCENENISYFLIEGSCLGAVRHHGFIPWDDDMDLAIPATVYEHFLKSIRRDIQGSVEVMGTFEQDIYPDNTDCMIKVFDKKIQMKIDVYMDEKIINPWIDVMLLYGLPGSILSRKIHFFKILVGKMFLKLSNKNSIGFNSKKRRSFAERMFLKLIQRIDTAKWLDERKQVAKLKKLLLKYPFETSKYVFAFPSDYRWKEIMPRSYYGKGAKVKYEDIEVTIPEQWDCYLKKIYGDYMKLPPENEQKPKHKTTIC